MTSSESLVICTEIGFTYTIAQVFYIQDTYLLGQLGLNRNFRLVFFQCEYVLLKGSLKKGIWRTSKNDKWLCVLPEAVKDYRIQ